MTVRSSDKTYIIGQATSPYPSPYARSIRVQSGTNTPKALRDRGIYTENAYNCNYQWILYPQTRLLVFGKPYWAGAQALSLAPTFHAVPPPAYSDVIPKLLEKWRASEFNLGVTLGEGKESAALMYGRLLSIAGSARALRKGDLRGALRSLYRVPKSAKKAARQRLSDKDFSGAWLELSLGWAPLINDIYALADMLDIKPVIGVIRASARNSVPSGFIGSGYVPDENLLVLKNERRLHMKVLVYKEPSVPERLGLTNPTGIAWALMPLSFVWDWFLPISDVIDSLHAIDVMPVVKCVETTVSKKAARVVVNAGEKYGNVTCDLSTVAQFKYTEMSRLVRDGLPSAWEIVAQIPKSVLSKAGTWDPSLRRLSIGAALAHQAIRSLK